MRPSYLYKPICLGLIILLRVSNMYIPNGSEICAETNEPLETSKLSVVLLIQVKFFNE